jgi:hypothetical protein
MFLMHQIRTLLSQIVALETTVAQPSGWTARVIAALVSALVIFPASLALLWFCFSKSLPAAEAQ